MPRFGFFGNIIKLQMIVIIFLAASCTQQYTKTDEKITGPLPREQISQETISIKSENAMDVDLKTDDNLNVKATFYKGNKDMPSIILLHMLGRTRGDWASFAIELQKIGYNIIAIDSRGHGQSDMDFRSFSGGDFNKMVLDAKAANDFLTKNEIGDKVGIIGASIGANTALNFAAQDSSIRTVILLSPGLEYRGIKTDEPIKQFKNPILIAASESDTYAADSSRTLGSLSKSSTLKIYTGSLHGTNLLGRTDINKIIVDWLDKNLR